MPVNESNLDRGIRAIGGVAALIAGFAVGASAVPGIVLLVVGAILSGTAAARFCPHSGCSGGRKRTPGRPDPGGRAAAQRRPHRPHPRKRPTGQLTGWCPLGWPVSWR